MQMTRFIDAWEWACLRAHQHGWRSDNYRVEQEGDKFVLHHQTFSDGGRTIFWERLPWVFEQEWEAKRRIHQILNGDEFD